jgi:hypothetical protein
MTATVGTEFAVPATVFASLRTRLFLFPPVVVFVVLFSQAF